MQEGHFSKIERQYADHPRQTPAKGNDMQNVIHRDVNFRQPDDGKYDKPNQVFDGRLGEQPVAERRTRVVQRLAALGEMTAGIAHDFRNILAVIEAGLILAEKNSEQSERMRSYIAGAREGVDRGLRLTSQLLTFARQQELDVHAGNANDFLRSLELFLRYGAGPGILIILELATDIPKCRIDPSQFNAAILNLVLNARDAMPDGGEVRISTARCEVKTATAGSPPTGTYVQVRVKDGGQGMSAETIQKIFDPFFTTKGEQGTGLGLPQVCAFMRRIGGHVRVTSEPGIGTTFDLLLPVVHPEEIVADRSN